jgi:4-hydroxy-tetrahydrodipicolinate reductase
MSRPLPKIKLAVGGALGRMGRAVLAQAKASPDIEIVGGWERAGHPGAGRDLGEQAGIGAMAVVLSVDPLKAMRDADVVIDFSTPLATMETLKAAAKTKPALVIGTTGMDKAQLKAVADYAAKAPCIHSSNYSIGINLLWKIAAEVAKVTGEAYDIEIVDMHHHHKKDAPSGTALTTAEVLAQALGRPLEELAVYGRHTREGKRLPGEIGIHALRAGDVVGDHTVYFAGPYERLELTHRAHSRENFAMGAVRAARWLVQNKKKAGLYNMAQVLGL